VAYLSNVMKIYVARPSCSHDTPAVPPVLLGQQFIYVCVEDVCGCSYINAVMVDNNIYHASLC